MNKRKICQHCIIPTYDKTKDYHNPNTRFKYVNNYLQITWVHFVSGRKNSLTYFSLVVLSVVNVRE